MEENRLVRRVDDLVWRVVFDSDDDENENSENGVLRFNRREYKMLERINVDCWDDEDFYDRFRLR